MPIEYSYKVLDGKNKKIEIKYHENTLKFQLKQKRSFTVLKSLLKKYPEFFPIHLLDGVLHDPNKALSELRIIDGFEEFITRRKDNRNATLAKIDIDKLFNKFEKDLNLDIFLKLTVGNLRENLLEEQKKQIFDKFKGICNITKIKLEQKLPSKYFFKNALEATYESS